MNNIPLAASAQAEGPGYTGLYARKTIPPEMQVIKQSMQEVWAAGDFGVIAKIIEDEGSNFINRLDIKPGDKVLDIACGTGNLSIPAAKRGALITGIDFVPDLIRQARERAVKEGLNARFDVGDAEALPYEDNEFDAVVSMFGIMFAPRPEVAISELFRVLKPGGLMATASWVPDGFIGDFFKLGASYLPPPPGIESPVLWGDETMMRQRIGHRVSGLNMNRVTFTMNLAMTPAEAVEHYKQYFGPTNKLFEALDEEKQKSFRADLIELWKKYNRGTDDILSVPGVYLEVIARKN
jgi:SAM-dependent methyltransferase